MLKEAAQKLEEVFSEKGFIRVITHIDADGISSGAIIAQLLKEKNQTFWLSFVKQLDDSFIKSLFTDLKECNCKAIIFLDLGSNKLNELESLKTKVFIVDHHQLENSEQDETESALSNVVFVNPLLESEQEAEKLSASGLSYLVAKNLNLEKKFAQVSLLGMIGDLQDKNISKDNKLILDDAKEAGMLLKRGLVVFSSLRPIHKSIEYSDLNVDSNLILRETGINIKKEDGTYTTLLDLDEQQTSGLLTSILLSRQNTSQDQDIIGNIYIVNIANQKWDARELATILNACGRLGYASVALSLLLDSRDSIKKIDEIYTRYKEQIVKGLNYARGNKIERDGYVTINAKDNIKDTMIGTIVSILASSLVYPDQTVLVGLAYREDKIKVSARVVRNNNNNNNHSNNKINLYLLLDSVIKKIGGEAGGHENAAGCLIDKEKEQDFLEALEEELKAIIPLPKR